MGKLVKMRVFIYGLRGVGLETAKNLILTGPKQVTLSDDNLVTINDLATNFVAKKQDVGKLKRSDCVHKYLKKLNPYVTVDVHYGKVDQKALENYNVLVVTDFYDIK